MAYLSMNKNQLEAVRDALLAHIMQPYTETIQFVRQNKIVNEDNLSREDLEKVKQLKRQSIVDDALALTEVIEALKDIERHKVEK